MVVTRFGRERRESPAALLERLLGLEPTRARELTSTLPSVVVARTTREHASLLAEQLRSEGADVQVVQTKRRAEPTGSHAVRQEPRRTAIREEVRASQDGRSDDASAGAARPEPRRAAVRELFAARADERETTPRVTREDRKVGAQPVPEQARAAEHAVELTPTASSTASAPTAAAATSGRSAGDTALAGAQAAAYAAEELTRRAREAAAMVALVEKDLGVIDFARFSEPANETAFRDDAPPVDPLAGAGLADDFGKDPLFPAHAKPAAPESQALVDEFDDVVNRPLAFAGALAKPAAKRHDSDIEELFSTPLHGGPTPARTPDTRAKTPGAARVHSPLPPEPLEVTVLDLKPRRGALLAKLGALLVAVLMFGMLGLTLADGDTSGAAQRTGGADAKLESGDFAPDDMHVLVRMMPRGMDRSMGVVLRQLVTGTYNVQIEVDDMPADTQCLLIKADDGKATIRLRKLLRTGARVPLSEEANAALDEHEQSLRLAVGAERMKFKRVCLSVDLYKDSLKTGAPE